MPWVKVPLGDVVQYINVRAFKLAEWEEKGLPIYSNSRFNKDVVWDKFNPEEIKTRYLNKRWKKRNYLKETL